MLKEKFYLRYKNVVIGIFNKVDKFINYIAIKEVADELGWSGYPAGLYPLIDEDDRRVPLTDYNPSKEDIEKWLGDRVFPAERQGGASLLKSMNLYSRNVWEIAKNTKAISLNDFYWMSDDLEDDYFSIHPRAKKDKVSGESDLSASIIVRTPSGETILTRPQTAIEKVVRDLRMGRRRRVRKASIILKTFSEEKEKSFTTYHERHGIIGGRINIIKRSENENNNSKISNGMTFFKPEDGDRFSEGE